MEMSGERTILPTSDGKAEALPREVVVFVLQHVLREGTDPYDYTRPKPACLVDFLRLRLVASHVKASAHLAWPGGVAHLAHGATASLLRPTLTEEQLPRKFDEARCVLSETRSLYVSLLAVDRHLLAADHHHAWLLRLSRVLNHTSLLGSLTLNTMGCRTSVPFRDLRLSHLPLRELHLEGAMRGSLAGLDLSSVTSLEIIGITGWPVFGMECQERRALGLVLPPRATSIELSKLALDSEDVDSLALGRQSRLLQLSLEGNRLTSPLPTLSASLKELNVAGCSWAPALFATVAPWASLEKVSVRTTALDSTAVFCLDANSSLKELDVTFTKIPDAASFHLATNTTLESLTAGGCPNLDCFAFGLSSNRTLKTLSLDATKWTPTLVRQFCDDLAGNSTLTELHLSTCRLEDEHMSHFRLGRTSGLVLLNLRGNPFTDTGLQLLFNSIDGYGLRPAVDLRLCAKVTEQFVNIAWRTTQTTAIWWEPCYMTCAP